MRDIQIFIVGPHNETRYNIIKNFIEKTYLDWMVEAKKPTINVMHPKMNPKTDLFNDWIFGKIDTSDLIISDLTNFNANVIYETAFAHSMGTPCIYVKFPDHIANDYESSIIKHYFKTSLIIDVSDADLISNNSLDFTNKLLGFFLDKSSISGDTILSQYYNSFPVDSEFMRGLADGYHKNFLGPILSEKNIPDNYKESYLYIVIPDTFEINDALLKEKINAAITDSSYVLYTNSTINTLGRPLGVKFSPSKGIFFDLPTTILTITESPKYRKIKSSYPRSARDKLTDILARKFVKFLWDEIDGKNYSILVNRLNFVWLSKLIGKWDNNSLMNDTPFERPDNFPLIENEVYRNLLKNLGNEHPNG